MKHLIPAVAAICIACGAQAFDNEAVRVLPGGKRIVELPPGPRMESLRHVQRTTDPWSPAFKLPAFVIDTDRGLVECTQRWIDSDCRPYVRGRDKRLRSWVVKTAGQWRVCGQPAVINTCVDYYAPPRHIVQE
jgi:hypothetical protein